MPSKAATLKRTRAQRIPFRPGVSTPTKAGYIRADQHATSLFACKTAADHTFPNVLSLATRWPHAALAPSRTARLENLFHATAHRSFGLSSYQLVGTSLILTETRLDSRHESKPRFLNAALYVIRAKGYSARASRTSAKLPSSPRTASSITSTSRKSWH
jgi:hypothetical protein